MGSDFVSTFIVEILPTQPLITPVGFMRIGRLCNHFNQQYEMAILFTLVPNMTTATFGLQILSCHIVFCNVFLVCRNRLTRHGQFNVSRLDTGNSMFLCLCLGLCHSIFSARAAEKVFRTLEKPFTLCEFQPINITSGCAVENMGRCGKYTLG